MGRPALLRVFVDLDNTLLTCRRTAPRLPLPAHIVHLPSVLIEASSKGYSLSQPQRHFINQLGEEPASELGDADVGIRHDNDCEEGVKQSVVVRPFAADFLRGVASLPSTQLSIFTANSSEYAARMVQEVLNAKLLPPNLHINILEDVFSNKHCTKMVTAREESFIENKEREVSFQYFQKDVDLADATIAGSGFSSGSGRSRWCLLVDDTIRSFVPDQFWRGSGILVSSFYAGRRWTVNDEVDSVLRDNVLPAIQAIHHVLSHSVEGQESGAIQDILGEYHADFAEKIRAVLSDDN
jgi:hypothetical protein